MTGREHGMQPTVDPSPDESRMEVSANDDECGVAHRDEQAITGTIKFIRMERDNVIASAVRGTCTETWTLGIIASRTMKTGAGTRMMITQQWCLVVDRVMNKHLVQSI